MLTSTACHPAGAAPLLSNKTYLAAAAGNFAVESYQAGAVRFILFNQEDNPYQMASGNAEAVYQITDVCICHAWHLHLGALQA